jgi:hypothetical protein
MACQYDFTGILATVRNPWWLTHDLKKTAVG